MPLYEYKCRACSHGFEALVRTGEIPVCPSCGSGDLERLLSLFAVSSDGSRLSALSSERRAGAKVKRDQQHAEMEAIRHHSH